MFTVKSEIMKVTKVRVNKAEHGKLSGFINEMNEKEDFAVLLHEGYYDDTLTIAAVGQLAMEYAIRNVEGSFNDYSIQIIK